MLVPRPFGERLAIVWLVCLVLVALLFGLVDFIQEFVHFFHLDVGLGSFVQLVHATRWFFAQTAYELVGA